MKKSKSITKRQREGMLRNAPSMSVKTQRKYEKPLRSFIMLIVSVKITRAKLGLSVNTRDGVFLLKARAIWQAITDDAGGFFAATPFALLATLNTQNGALATEMQNVELGVMGAEGAKIAAKVAVKLTLDAAVDYVNGLARLDQPNAVEIITTANMQVANAPAVKKQEFAVKQGEATGEIKLASLAAKIEGKYVKASYEWQYSTDNGVRWISLDATVRAKTVSTGMEVDIKTLFRKRYTTSKGGTTAWCTPIAITPV
ncbi:MAG: hypothetical protein ACHQNT_05605 [Bacteroidia bacterium]